MFAILLWESNTRLLNWVVMKKGEISLFFFSRHSHLFGLKIVWRFLTYFRKELCLQFCMSTWWSFFAKNGINGFGPILSLWSRHLFRQKDICAFTSFWANDVKAKVAPADSQSRWWAVRGWTPWSSSLSLPHVMWCSPPHTLNLHPRLTWQCFLCSHLAELKCVCQEPRNNSDTMMKFLASKRKPIQQKLKIFAQSCFLRWWC